jgi:S1-C subfamily serine protease
MRRFRASALSGVPCTLEDAPDRYVPTVRRRMPISKNDLNKAGMFDTTLHRILWMFAALMIASLATAARPAAAQELEKSIVRITSKTSEGQLRSGTGFIVKIDADALFIVTAAHLVGGNRTARVEFFDRSSAPVDAKVEHIEVHPFDMALLVVYGRAQRPPGVSELRFAPDAGLLGPQVQTVRFRPDAAKLEMTNPSVTRMILSGPIDESNAGGPVLKDGLVVGMVAQASLSLAEAVPATSIKRLLGRWGVEIATVNQTETSGIASESGYARLDLVRGPVSIYRDSGKLEGQPGMSLQRGDEIETARDGVALVVYGTQNRILLAGGTRVRLGSLEVEFGKVFAWVQGLFSTSGENIVAGVKGTRFQFEVDPERTVRILVVEGTVVVNSKSKSWSQVTVLAGNRIISPYPSADRPSPEPVNERELKDNIRWIGETFSKEAAVPSPTPGSPKEPAVPAPVPQPEPTRKPVPPGLVALPESPNGPAAPAPVPAPEQPKAPAPARESTQTPASSPTAPVSPLKVGDKWTYDYLFNGRKVDTLTVEVKAVSANSVTEQISSERFRSRAERTFKMVFDPGAFQEVQIGQAILVEFSPYVAPYSGEWDITPTITYQLTFNPKVHKALPMKLRSAGPDQVTVPAGTFEAIKIVAESTWKTPVGGAKTVQMEFWYAAKIKRTVKMSETILDWAGRTGNDQHHEFVLKDHSEH